MLTREALELLNRPVLTERGQYVGDLQIDGVEYLECTVTWELYSHRACFDNPLARPFDPPPEPFWTGYREWSGKIECPWQNKKPSLEGGSTVVVLQDGRSSSVYVRRFNLLDQWRRPTLSVEFAGIGEPFQPQ